MRSDLTSEAVWRPQWPNVCFCLASQLTPSKYSEEGFSHSTILQNLLLKRVLPTGSYVFYPILATVSVPDTKGVPSWRDRNRTVAAGEATLVAGFAAAAVACIQDTSGVAEAAAVASFPFAVPSPLLLPQRASAHRVVSPAPVSTAFRAPVPASSAARAVAGTVSTLVSFASSSPTSAASESDAVVQLPRLRDIVVHAPPREERLMPLGRL